MDSLSHSLDLLSDTYNYNHWLYSLLRPYLGDHVLEVGSGCGNITRFLLDRKQVWCLEPEKAYYEKLLKLSECHSNISPVLGDDRLLMEGDLSKSCADTVVCLNVLEHIKDDAETIKRFHRVLRVGGHVLLLVPAAGWAYGELDRQMGHFRRYARRGVRSLVERGGFEVLKCHYVNGIGVWGWFWESRVMKVQRIDPQKARLVDRYVPFLSSWEKLMHPLVGQSLFLVGRKRNSL